MSLRGAFFDEGEEGDVAIYNLYYSRNLQNFRLPRPAGAGLAMTLF